MKLDENSLLKNRNKNILVRKDYCVIYFLVSCNMKNQNNNENNGMGEKKQKARKMPLP